MYSDKVGLLTPLLAAYSQGQVPPVSCGKLPQGDGIYFLMLLPERHQPHIEWHPVQKPTDQNIAHGYWLT